VVLVVLLHDIAPLGHVAPHDFPPLEIYKVLLGLLADEVILTEIMLLIDLLDGSDGCQGLPVLHLDLDVSDVLAIPDLDVLLQLLLLLPKALHSRMDQSLYLLAVGNHVE
jgi:hypothetical protein